MDNKEPEESGGLIVSSNDDVKIKNCERLHQIDDQEKYGGINRERSVGSVEELELSVKYPNQEKCEKVVGWFARDGPKTMRNVWVAFKVKRLSDIDNVAQTYRMRFHFYFNWLMTKEDYLSYLNHQYKNDLEKWKPTWFPHLEFENQNKSDKCEWEEYPNEGKFRLQTFQKFNINDSKIKQNIENAKFIRAKKECDITFSEELELQNFPLDCQDLTCIILERTKPSRTNVQFVPELRNSKFGGINPKYSLINEWDLKGAILELGNLNSTRTKESSYPCIILRLKMERKWMVFLWRVIFLMICISGLILTSFSIKIHYDDKTDSYDGISDRLELIVTLLLTAVSFMSTVFEKLPNVVYLTFLERYITVGHTFCIFMMIETSLIPICPNTLFINDHYIFLISLIIFVVYNLIFICYGIYVKNVETKKLHYSTSETEDKVNHKYETLTFDYRTNMERNNDKTDTNLKEKKFPMLKYTAERSKITEDTLEFDTVDTNGSHKKTN